MGRALHTIDVKQDHIDRGQRESLTQCAFVIAIAEAYPSTRRIRVDNSKRRISFIDSITRQVHIYAMPDRLVTWVDRWDNGLPVEPFRLNLTDRMLIKTRPINGRRTSQLGKVSAEQRAARVNKPAKAKTRPAVPVVE